MQLRKEAEDAYRHAPMLAPLFVDSILAQSTFEAAIIHRIAVRLANSAIAIDVLPALVGLRYSLGAAWLSLVVGEQINADRGIGYLIMDARDFLRTDIIIVGLLIYAILGLATDAIVRGVERRALAWRPSMLRPSP
jgi:ABC-type proline/glycine betaine transport system permease subunit